MEAGRELDALVAEKVMGWKADLNKHNRWVVVDGDGERREAHDKAVYYHPETGEKVEEPWWEHIHPPAYSDNIAAAWEVVERFDAWAIGKRAIEGDGIGCTVHVGREWYEATAPTAPLVICLAALKAAGVEVSANA